VIPALVLRSETFGTDGATCGKTADNNDDLRGYSNTCPRYANYRTLKIIELEAPLKVDGKLLPPNSRQSD